MNRNKDSCWINLGLVDITTEYILNFSQDVLPNPRSATHIDLLSSPTSHSETKSNSPTPEFNIIAETPTSFRRFERSEKDDLKNEIILETETNINKCFQRKLLLLRTNTRNEFPFQTKIVKFMLKTSKKK